MSLAAEMFNPPLVIGVSGSGWDTIQEYAKRLEARHEAHMAAYGGAERLLGAYYAPAANNYRSQ